jgi:1-acyl-sn-glycerol-3-phosphate acyltransferase
MRRIVKASVMGSLDTLLACCIRLTVVGREHIPSSGPFVLAANHCSHLDTAMVRRALGAEAARLQVVAARDYFFTSPAKGWLFSALFNTLPWDRSGFPLRGLELCHRVLDGGHSILIFPEGTRSPSGTLQPFRPGIGVLAWELPYPVVPVHVAGTFRALPRGARILRPGPVTVRFGPALDVRSIKGVASLNGSVGPRSTPYRRAAAAIQAAVEELAP